MAHDCHFSLIQRCYDIINGGNSYVTKNCPMSFTTSASLIEFLFQLSKAQTQFRCGRSTGFSFTKFTERKTPSKQEKKKIELGSVQTSLPSSITLTASIASGTYICFSLHLTCLVVVLQLDRSVHTTSCRTAMHKYALMKYKASYHSFISTDNYKGIMQL